MGTLKIEKIGGFAGFGVAGSRLRSSGQQTMSALSAADRASVEALFKNPAGHKEEGKEPHPFRYRITRTKDGKVETVEVHESAVPQALKDCVTDEIM